MCKKENRVSGGKHLAEDLLDDAAMTAAECSIRTLGNSGLTSMVVLPVARFKSVYGDRLTATTSKVRP